MGEEELTSQIESNNGYTGDTFMSELGDLVVWIVSIAGVLMVLYAVYIGYLFATATDASKRKAARERLLKTIASSLIIIALATVLSVINVTFNKPEGGMKGSGSEIVVASQFEYVGEPSFIFTCNNNEHKVTGTFKVESKYVMLDGQPYDGGNKDNFTFASCKLVGPDGFPRGKENFDISTRGEGTYTIEISYDPSGHGDERHVTIPYMVDHKDEQHEQPFVTFAFNFTLIDNPKMDQWVYVNLIIDNQSNSSYILFKKSK